MFVTFFYKRHFLRIGKTPKRSYDLCMLIEYTSKIITLCLFKGYILICIQFERIVLLLLFWIDDSSHIPRHPSHLLENITLAKFSFCPQRQSSYITSSAALNQSIDKMWTNLKKIYRRYLGKWIDVTLWYSDILPDRPAEPEMKTS